MFSKFTLPKAKPFMPAHGGALRAAAQYFNIPLDEWLDLSTGINPASWPVPDIPQSVWQRLPEQESPCGPYSEADASLESAALAYYLNEAPAGQQEGHTQSNPDAQNVLPCAGSQQAIRLLPCLYSELHKNTKPGIKIQNEVKVWVTSGSYSEHAKAWEGQGYRVAEVAYDRITKLLTQQPVDVLILVNPDNPSGHCWTPEQLLKWWSILQSRGGWLIIDEAFMDMSPENSLVPYVDREGLFVLRSVGKFFGLAGIRLGFMLAKASYIRHAQRIIGPWAVSHPAQYIGQCALQDTQWISQQRDDLKQQSQRLTALLEYYFNVFSSLTANKAAEQNSVRIQATDLFCTVYFDQAQTLFYLLAEQGILTRYLPPATKTQAALRFGLPGKDEKNWNILEDALLLIAKTIESN